MLSMRQSELSIYLKWTKMARGIIILCCLLVSCGQGTRKNKAETPGQEVDSPPEDQRPKTEQDKKDSIILYEDHMGDIPLPFPKREMLNELRQAFASLVVQKEIGEQDGPDFPLYSLKGDDGEIAYFSMHHEDTLQLIEVHIGDPRVKDEYGLRVGNTYQKIRQLREGKLKTYTDYHQHTYAYFDNSPISYEISGDDMIANTVDQEDITFTEEQMQDWTIQFIIWRE